MLSKDGKHACHCYAHNSYDEGLARAVLVFARDHDIVAPQELPLTVAEGFAHPGYGFDTVASWQDAPYSTDAERVALALVEAHYDGRFPGKPLGKNYSEQS